MELRRHIFLGFALVLLPPLFSAYWAYQSGVQVSRFLDKLDQSLFPILEVSNRITLRLSELSDLLYEVSLAPNEEGFQKCREDSDLLMADFRQLLTLSEDEEVRELRRLTESYCDQSLGLIRRSFNTDQDLFMSEGDELADASSTLIKQLKDYRTRKSDEFSSGLKQVNLSARKISWITGLTSLAALAFGLVLAFWIGNNFAQTNRRLTEAKSILELRFDELSLANIKLESEVLERKRAEEALRRSLRFEEALSQVSKLFTGSHLPNLREVAKILGQVVHSNVAFIGLLKGPGFKVEKQVEWTRGEPGETIPPTIDLDLRRFPIWLDLLSVGRTVEISNRDEMSDDAYGERHFMDQYGLKAILLIPINSKEQSFWGYMGYGHLQGSRAWSKEDIRILKVACEMLANYMARQQAEERLKHDAFHDSLTGLPNRSLVMERLNHAFKRMDRNPDDLFAVLFIDLDRFKPVNDSLGHHVGDQLLFEVGQRLQECVRSVDTVARLGGDEFITLLEKLDSAEEAETVADRILTRLSEAFILEDQEVFISCSIGIAVLDKAYKDMEDVLRDADIAMYRAKVQGKSRYVMFHRSMQTQSLSTFKLESDLRRALERHEFELHYQPIISLTQEKVIGFESLLRWRHPSRGMVSPAEFIPIAEDSGLMQQIGSWVLEEACTQTRLWHNAGFDELSIAVNVSARQFYGHGLSGFIKGVLEDTGLPPSFLKVEITESILMENVDSNIQMMKELKELGLMILIDDFGTGYSSLSYLKRFPLDTLKIDQSFIRDLPDDLDDAAITTTVIAMANSLNLGVIAEGVENLSQLKFLRDSGCYLVQGYHFSKPLPSMDATRFLEEQDIKHLIHG